MAIGDVLAVPATLGADVWLVVAERGAGRRGGGAGVERRAARSAADGPRPGDVVVAGLVALVAAGITRLGELATSQLTNALPDPVVRAVIAAGLVAVVPGIVVLVRARLAERRQVPTTP